MTIFQDINIRIAPFVTILVLGYSSITYAQGVYASRRRPNDAPRFELNEIVVTASKIEEPIRRIPKNVTVITKEDIQQAPSNNIVDLLSRESGIILKSLFGHDKGAGVDIRGMGATSGSNIIIMVDGVRLNPPDLADPDLSSIHLDRIERIEILRGGGSVFYGDGAVGGVINIITKKGERKSDFHSFYSYGSYETHDFRVSFNRPISNLMFNGSADYYDSDGYRENGGIEKRDASIQAGYEWGDHIRLSLKGSIHEDRYGLPGPLINRAYLDSKVLRRTASRPEDYGKTNDRNLTAGMEIETGPFGVLSVQRGYRSRRNPYILGFTELKSEAEQMNRIDEDTRPLSVQYNLPYRFKGSEHRFWCGLDHYETEYVTERLSDDERKNGMIRDLGFFLANEWTLDDDVLWRLGYRHNRLKGRYREDERTITWSNGDVFTRTWSNEAYETGILYDLNDDTSLYVNLSTSFRVPNVDELALADPNLHPQKGKHIDIGVRQRIKGRMELAINLFQMETEDEIYYMEDPNGTAVNRNYEEKTLRRGLEMDVKCYPMPDLYLWGNYSYIDARLKKRDTFIPLVPRHKATVGLEWQISRHLLFHLTGTFVGSCFDGNDSDNNLYEKLGGYEVLDLKFTYECKGWKVFTGINNIFDEYYSTIAYSGVHYPMPTRNLFGGIQWHF
ncbi:MAG: TonB-dependent receptor [bacterium]